MAPAIKNRMTHQETIFIAVLVISILSPIIVVNGIAALIAIRHGLSVYILPTWLLVCSAACFSIMFMAFVYLSCGEIGNIAVSESGTNKQEIRYNTQPNRQKE